MLARSGFASACQHATPFGLRLSARYALRASLVSISAMSSLSLPTSVEHDYRWQWFLVRGWARFGTGEANMLTSDSRRLERADKPPTAGRRRAMYIYLVV